MNGPTGSPSTPSMFPLYTTTMHLFSARRWVTVNETIINEKVNVPVMSLSPFFRYLFSYWGNVWSDFAPQATAFTSGTMLIIAMFLAFGFDSMVSMVWELRHNELLAVELSTEETTSSDSNGVHQNAPSTSKAPKDGWQSTFVYGLTHSITTAARVYLGLIVTEVALDWCPRFVQLPLLVYHASGENAHLHSNNLESLRLQEAAPIIALIIWLGLTIATVKRIILLQSLNHSTKKRPAPPTKPPYVSGRTILFNRMLDVVIYFIMALFILNEISMDASTNSFILNSLLSAGGIGALILSFATKDLATEIVGGVALGVWNIFNVGDRVRLDNGISGKVLEIGVVETIIQRYEFELCPLQSRITQRLSYLSSLCPIVTITSSRVYQTLS
jgi:Mechanosensitive ion channel